MSIKEKIIVQGFIDVDDVKDIKFITPIFLSQKLLKLLEKIAIHIGINKDELGYILGLKKKPITEIKEEEKAKDEVNLNQALVGAFKIFVLDAYDDNGKPNDLLDELVTILSKIISYDKEIILSSDIEVFIELVFRPYFKYRNEVNKGFFTSMLISQVTPYLGKVFPSLVGMRTES